MPTRIKKVVCKTNNKIAAIPKKVVAPMSLHEFMSKELENIQSLFKEKSKQYGSLDELLNFTIGGILLQGPTIQDMLDAQFETAKAYMAKHVSFLYSAKSGNVENPKIKESLGDIVVYGLIMKYMMYRKELEDK